MHYSIYVVFIRFKTCSFILGQLPKAFMQYLNSVLSIAPEPSVSKISKAYFNTAFCSSVKINYFFFLKFLYRILLFFLLESRFKMLIINCEFLVWCVFYMILGAFIILGLNFIQTFQLFKLVNFICMSLSCILFHLNLVLYRPQGIFY